MSTIFSDLFSRNLERVNARNHRQENAIARSREQVSKDFESALVDSARKDEKANLLGMLEQTKGEPADGGEHLSANAAHENTRSIRARLNPLISEIHDDSFIAHEDLRSNNTQCTERATASVKTTAHGVKESASVNSEAVKLGSILPQQMPILPDIAIHNLPTTPVVISSSRLKGYNLPLGSQSQSTSGVGRVKEIVVAAGKYHGIDPNLSLAIAEAESSYRPNAISSDGHKTKGVFQLLDSTGKQMKEIHGIKEAYDPFDPGMNAFLGVGYLRRLMGFFSKDTKLDSKRQTTAAQSSEDLEKLALAAFNAGEGNVVRAQQRAKAAGKNPASYEEIAMYLPESTQKYVQKVLLRKNDFNRNRITEFA